MTEPEPSEEQKQKWWDEYETERMKSIHQPEGGGGRECPHCHLMVTCGECLAQNYCEVCGYFTLGSNAEYQALIRSMQSFSFQTNEHGKIAGFVG